MKISTPMVTSSAVVIVAMTALLSMTCPAQSFVVQPMTTTTTGAASTPVAPAVALSSPRGGDRRHNNSLTKSYTSSCLSAASDVTAQSTTNTLTLTLEKPLGLILEEVESTTSSTAGVIVTQVNENGSAYTSSYRDSLPQMKIKSVMGKVVTAFTLEEVMDVIIGAPSPVDIEFISLYSSSSASVEMHETTTPDTTSPKYEVGTPVTITVQQPSETRKPEITIEAKVGDNLRKTLLANPDIELYRGLKKKLGNCGGGGQCGFCAVEVIDMDEEGKVWGERSDYEATKIGKNGNGKTRLACLNNIAGPAIVKTL